MTNKTPASRVNKTSYAHGRISSARSRERLSLLLWVATHCLAIRPKVVP